MQVYLDAYDIDNKRSKGWLNFYNKKRNLNSESGLFQFQSLKKHLMLCQHNKCNMAAYAASICNEFFLMNFPTIFF